MRLFKSTILRDYVRLQLGRALANDVTVAKLISELNLAYSSSIFIQIRPFVLTSNTWLVITWANNLYAGWDEVTVH